MRETVLHFAVYAGWPKASRFNIAVDLECAKIAEARGEPPPPEPLLPLVTASDPEQRLQGGEESSRRSTACRSRRCATTPTRERAF